MPLVIYSKEEVSRTLLAAPSLQPQFEILTKDSRCEIRPEFKHKTKSQNILQDKQLKKGRFVSETVGS